MIDQSRRWSALLVSVGAFALVGLIAYLDYRTGDIVFTVSYLIPVLLTARYGSRGSGLLMALIASISMLLAERIVGSTYTSPLVAAWDFSARFAVFASVAFLVRSLRTQLALAQRQASTDSLTGMISRGRFLAMLGGEVGRTRRYGHPLSLAYVDVDDFKQVNDTHGHAAGDRLLRCIARTLRAETRTIDIAGRVGGDEFMLLMPETEAADARALIERLQQALNQASCAENLPVTFSIGVLTFLGNPEGTDQAVHQVDDLMYQVKRGGKNGFLHQIVQ